jgi:hypothetical protein
MRAEIAGATAAMAQQGLRRDAELARQGTHPPVADHQGEIDRGPPRMEAQGAAVSRYPHGAASGVASGTLRGRRAAVNRFERYTRARGGVDFALAKTGSRTGPRPCSGSRQKQPWMYARDR